MLKELEKDLASEEGSEEYHSEDFKIAEPYFDKLVADLLPSIRNHEYSTIVGDDSSGRIATLVLRKFINESYKRDGIELPETIFYAGGYVKDSRGGRDHTDQKVFEAIAEDFKKKKKDNGKVLVVTEYIYRGLSMDNLVNALSQSSAECEVATLGMAEDKDEFLKEHPDLRTLTKTKVFSGGEIPPHAIIPFYKEPGLAGVKKEYLSSKIHAKSILNDRNNYLEKTRQAKDLVKNARVDTKHLAEKLIAEYL